MLTRELRRTSALFGLVCMYSAMVLAAPPPPSGPLLVVRLSEGPILLSRPWLFHLGDGPTWADPNLADSRWNLVSATEPWASQGHFGYTGYAWYRLHVEFQPDSDSCDVALLVPHVDDAYEIYWNGALAGRHGKLPPYPLWPQHAEAPQVIQLGSARSGVLALRVWKAPLFSEDSGLRGGFTSPPVAGTPYAIVLQKQLLDYHWLRTHQLSFTLNALYCIAGLLTLLAWIEYRHQWQLFWMAGFAIPRVLEAIIYARQLPIPLTVANALWQPFSAFRSVSLWFLLLWLLELRQNTRLVRLVRYSAWFAIPADSVDGLLCMLIWLPGWTVTVQILDGAITAIYTLTLMLPLVLVVVAVVRRQGLNKTRWVVALSAFAAGMVEVIRNAVPQGSRFTGWTFEEVFTAPLWTLRGNPVSIVMITSTLLLLTSAFAVYRSFEESRRRQSLLNTEFENARALQQVLVPEEPPAVAGFRVACIYRPALQVGGDFVQVIPLDNDEQSTLVLLGDVSGKGLRAAMAVSFIVGASRALVARHICGPAALLSELNERLIGRLQGGFATCLALRLEPNGRCLTASAGHPPPSLDGRPLLMEFGFPLGLFGGTSYGEFEFTIQPHETVTLYTDGLTESQNKNGQIFGEERLDKLLASRPTPAEIAQAAIDFGQEDDITIACITRTELAQESRAADARNDFAERMSARA
jgi:hypothetical protein